MSNADNRIIQIAVRANPLQVMEIRGLATKEKEFVISNVIFSDEWKAGDFGETDRRTQIPFKPSQTITETDILTHFAPLLDDTLDVFDGVSGSYLSQSISSIVISPSTASKAASTTQQYTVAILPASVSQEVVWSIQVVANLSISQTGLVTIGAVAPGTYTLTATSVAYPTVADTATITVTP